MADAGCVDLTSNGTRLIIRESVPTRETLLLRTGRGPAQTVTDLGDPTVGGGTRYALCLYGQSGDLVQDYVVDRAGDTCGSRPCWRLKGRQPVGGPRHRGYRYIDRFRDDDGVRNVTLVAQPNGRLSVRGRNSGGSANLPTGVTAALAGATSATVQLHGSDAAVCLSVTLGNVRRATPTGFVATD